jgi:hypothetical protein
MDPLYALVRQRHALVRAGISNNKLRAIDALGFGVPIAVLIYVAVFGGPLLFRQVAVVSSVLAIIGWALVAMRRNYRALQARLAAMPFAVSGYVDALGVEPPDHANLKWPAVYEFMFEFENMPPPDLMGRIMAFDNCAIPTPNGFQRHYWFERRKYRVELWYVDYAADNSEEIQQYFDRVLDFARTLHVVAPLRRVTFIRYPYPDEHGRVRGPRALGA